MKPQVLEEYLLKNIPLSSAMGVRVESITSEKVILNAPFSNNINHKQTVFGGSLHAVATLACWSLLHVHLNEIYGNKVQIIIANSEIQYLAPVASDFKAECSMPNIIDWEKFIKIFDKKDKARIKLKGKIYKEDQLLVDYSGTFVAIKIKT